MEESFDFIYIEWAHEAQTLQLIRVFLVFTMWSFFLLLQPKRCPAFNSLFRMFLSCFNNTRHRANTPQANSNKKRAKSRWSERAVVDTRTRDTAMLWRPKTGFVVDYKIYLIFFSLLIFGVNSRARSEQRKGGEEWMLCCCSAVFMAKDSPAVSEQFESFSVRGELLINPTIARAEDRRYKV